MKQLHAAIEELSERFALVLGRLTPACRSFPSDPTNAPAEVSLTAVGNDLAVALAKVLLVNNAMAELLGALEL